VLELRDSDIPGEAAPPQHALAGAGMITAEAVGIRGVSADRRAVAVALGMHQHVAEVMRWL
jgi:hypothetical protein